MELSKIVSVMHFLKFLMIIFTLGSGLLFFSSAQANVAPKNVQEAEARALFQKAEVHFSVGEFAEAISLYKEAYKIKPLPGFLFNIGQCHFKLGQYNEALFYYENYLQRNPQAANREQVENLIEESKKKMKESPAAKATAPAPSTSSALPTSIPAVNDQSTGATVTSHDNSRPPRTPAESYLLRRKIILWSGIGVTSALAIVGTITGIVSISKSSTYNEPDTSLSERQSLRDSGLTNATISVATLAAGAVIGAATGVYWYKTKEQAKQMQTASAPWPATRWSAIPINGGALLTWGGTY